MIMPQKNVKYDVLCIAVRQAFAKTSTYRLRWRSVCADTCTLVHTDSYVQARRYRFVYKLVRTDCDVQTRVYRLVGTDLYVQTRVHGLVHTDLYVQARRH